MATHSSVLAWRIPGTGEPGGLQSMGSHRVGQDWSNLAAVVRMGFPGGSVGKESLWIQKTRVRSPGWEDPLRGPGPGPGAGHGDPFQDPCLENPHGQRSLGDYSPWGCKEPSRVEWLSLSLIVRTKATHAGTLNCTFVIYQIREIRHIIYKDIMSTEVMPLKDLAQWVPLSTYCIFFKVTALFTSREAPWRSTSMLAFHFHPREKCHQVFFAYNHSFNFLHSSSFKEIAGIWKGSQVSSLDLWMAPFWELLFHLRKITHLGTFEKSLLFFFKCNKMLHSETWHMHKHRLYWDSKKNKHMMQ